MRQVIIKKGTESVILGTNGEDVLIKALMKLCFDTGTSEADLKEATILLRHLGIGEENGTYGLRGFDE